MEHLPVATESGVTRSQAAWAHALEATDIDDFFQRVQSGAPKEWVLWNDRIKSFADQYFRKEEEFVPEFTQADFEIPEALRDWWFDNVQVSTPAHGPKMRHSVRAIAAQSMFWKRLRLAHANLFSL